MACVKKCISAANMLKMTTPTFIRTSIQDIHVLNLEEGELTVLG